MGTFLNNQPPEFFIKGVLERDTAILSRAITLVESRNEAHRELASAIMSGIVGHAGRSFRLGITGVPGVGKSTFIESFGKEVIRQGHKLAVLAIDPSSTLSKGSILGDKTRMEELSAMKDVYIRPTASGGSLGGVSRSTYETILLVEAAGYDFIIIETVGVGQSETAVGKITDFFLLLMLAGAGDELQGIKRGIMEMADALVITKADGDNLEKAKAARSEYALALHLLQPPASGWMARTQLASGITNYGITNIYAMLEEFRRLVIGNGFFSKKRKEQQSGILREVLNEEILRKFYEEGDMENQLREIEKKENINPFAEATRILASKKRL